VLWVLRFADLIQCVNQGVLAMGFWCNAEVNGSAWRRGRDIPSRKESHGCFTRRSFQRGAKHVAKSVRGTVERTKNT